LCQDCPEVIGEVRLILLEHAVTPEHPDDPSCKVRRRH